MVATSDSTNKSIWPKILLTAFMTMLLTAVLMALLVKYYFFPSPFKPVALSSAEEQTLTNKLNRLSPGLGSSLSANNNKTTKLQPKPYTEDADKRKVKFNEREVNALLAHNTDLADKLAIDFSNNLVSANLLVPLEPDFPVMGGKTVRVNMGMQLNYDNQRMIAKLKGISIMGIPLPNAWLGNLKNVDLIQEFGNQDGFWKTFSAGIEHIQVEEGGLQLKLKE